MVLHLKAIAFMICNHFKITEIYYDDILNIHINIITYTASSNSGDDRNIYQSKYVKIINLSEKVLLNNNIIY